MQESFDTCLQEHFKYRLPSLVLLERIVYPQFIQRAFLANNPTVPTVNGFAFSVTIDCTLSHNSRSIIGSCVPSTLIHWSFGIGLFCFVLYETLPYFP